MNRRGVWAGVAAVVASLAVSASADTVYLAAGPVKNVKIKGVEGGSLVYDSAAGATRRELGSIKQIQIDGETALNTAEEAFAREAWADAVDGYVRTARATNKPWLAEWSATRLVTSANKAGRLDAAASGYVTLLLVNPELAAKSKPSIPEKSTFLDSAIKEAENKLPDAKTPDQKKALLGFLLELHGARGDTKRATDVAMELGKIGALAPQAQAALKLGLANAAMEKKDYNQVIDQVESGRTTFVEPQQQADALFLLAEAKAQLAGDDERAMKDAALAYMRVVAHFGSTEGKPHVAMSLVRTADLLQKLKDVPAALKLYQRVAEEHPSDPAGREAKQKADALTAASKPS